MGDFQRINYPRKEPQESRRARRNAYAVTSRGILTDKRNLVVPFRVIYAPRDSGISLLSLEGKIFAANRVALGAAVIVGMIDEFLVIVHRYRHISVILGIFICCNSV